MAGGTLTVGGYSSGVGAPSGTLTNNGTWAATGGTLTFGSIAVTNFSAGTLTGGTWQASGTGILRGFSSGVTTDAATIVVDGSSAKIYTGSSGTTNALTGLASISGGLTIQNGYNLTIAPSTLSNTGTVKVGTGSTLAGPGGFTYTQTAGSTSGAGTIIANVTNSGGTTYPSGVGGIGGTLAVTGNFTQTSGSTLNINISGSSAGQYDKLSVSGVASLGGPLTLNGSYNTLVGEVFTIVAGASVTGTFAGLPENATIGFNGRVLQVHYTPTTVTLTDIVPNTAPVVAANAASLTVNEGSTATNTGTFSDAQGNSTVTLTSTIGGQAIGTVTKNDANGTWSWSYTPAEEAAAQTVTITATDSAGATATTTFSLTVNDAPLTAGTLTPPNGGAGSPQLSTFANGILNNQGVAIDSSGNVFVTNNAGGIVYKITPAGVVSTFATGLSWPHYLTVDVSDNLYVSNYNNNTIGKITPAGVVTTYVDNTHGLNGPAGLVFDASGNLYVANGAGSSILKVTPAGVVATVPGTSGFSGMRGMTIDSHENLYITNPNSSNVIKVTQAGAVSIFASGLSGPYGATVDSADNVYVANISNHTLSKVTPAGVVSTFISSGLSGPADVATDRQGNMYVANHNANTVSKITVPTLLVNEGQAFINVPVFHFTDANPAGTASDFTAVVTLGDGNTVTLNSSGKVSGPAAANGQIVASAGGGFDVQLSYTYADSLSNATFSVVVTDHTASASNSRNTFSVANVAPTFEAGLNATLTPPVAGAFSRTGIQISDPGSPETFAGTVNYGDGTLEALTIDQATRRFDLSHTYASAGLFTVIVNLNDGDGGNASDSFTVDVTLNNPPVVAAEDASVTGYEGGTVTNAGTFSDAEGNSTVTLTSTVGGVPFGTVTKDDTNGTWSWSASVDDGDAGPFTVTITATDNQGVTANTTFTYAVINAVPTATFASNGPVAYGQALTVSFSNQHDDSTADTTAGFHYAYSVTGDFTGITYASGSSTTATHDYTGLNAGDYTFFARIIDKDGGFSDYSKLVTINAANPTVAVNAPDAARNGIPYAATGTVTGANGEPGSTLEGVGLSFTYYLGAAATGTPVSAPVDFGTYTVVASFAGSANYATAESTPATFHITPASDIQIVSAKTNGATTLTVSYNIANLTAPQFDIGFYLSDDELFAGDSQFATVTISLPADLTVGSHVKTFAIGTGVGQVPLPGAGATEVDTDYFLLAAADPTDVILEGVGGSDEYNVAALTGVYHATTGAVMVQGGSAIDTVSISGTTTLTLTFNGTPTTYTSASTSVTGFRIRTHGGNDVVNLASATTTTLVHGGADNDTLAGGTVTDRLFGGTGNDTLTGNAGNDTLIGGAGDDSLIGGAGDDTYIFAADTTLGTDTLNESGGIDTLDFSGTLTSAVNVNLGLATVQVVSGTNLSLVLRSAATFENAIGGAQADNFLGNTLANILNGGAGNDTLTGGAGNDTLVGGDGSDSLSGAAGNDTLIGGADNDVYAFTATSALGSDTLDESGGGIDTLDFSLTTTVAVTVDLSNAASQVVNANLSLTLSAGDTFEKAIGGSLDDLLSGNTLANVLIGNAGNDTLTGGAGDDTLVGGAGNDTYKFAADAALGIDTLDEVGGGIDTLDFSATASLGVAVNLELATSQFVNSNLTLILGLATSFENVLGGAQSDSITGNANNNVLVGAAGDDTLVGGVGNDTYRFTADAALGSDTLDESGGGIDTLDFSTTSGTVVSVDLSLTTPQTVNANLTLTLNSAATFENIVGGSLGDTLVGNDNANALTGNGGNDVLTGGAGNDSMIGGAGDDRFTFAADTALGTDTLNDPQSTGLTFNGSTNSLQVGNFGARPTQGTISFWMKPATVTSYQNPFTTNNSGGNAAIRFEETSAGQFYAVVGNDAGTFQNPVFTNSLAANTWVQVALTWDSSTNNLVGYLDGVQKFSVTNTFWVTNFSNMTFGLGFGSRYYNGSLADVRIYDVQRTQAQIQGDKDQVLTGIEVGLIGYWPLNDGASTTATDKTASPHNGTLSGSPLPTWSPGPFASGMSGGIDTLDFSGTLTTAVTVNLATTGTQVVSGTNLSLILGSATAFENVIGGSWNDTLTGNTQANTLSGGAGNDRLSGGAGNDILIGGADNDVYAFTATSALGSDTLDESGGGIDTLDFSLTTTFVVAVDLSKPASQPVNANLTLTLMAGDTIENVTGGSLNDVITGNALANILIGGAGNDTLTGAAGNDTLTGGAGNDTLIGGADNDVYVFAVTAALGTDTLDESAGGIDTLDFTGTTAAITVNLGLPTVQVVNTNLSLIPGLALENVIGGSGNDTLTGNELNNALTGAAGNDTLSGLAGDDTLVGGAGNDTYRFTADGLPGSLGSDTLDESGGGLDTLDFTATAVNVNVNLGIAASQVINSSLSLTLSSTSTFENVIGGSGNDTLTGNDNANALTGNAGNDLLTGGAGNDSLVGGAGDDTYTFAADTTLGTDTLNETGGGVDTLDFSNTLISAVNVNLGLTTAQVVNSNLTLNLGLAPTFENVIGGSQGDKLTGNGFANILSGGAGDDTLNGGIGDDTLNGGDGNDVYAFTANSVLGIDTLSDDSGTDLLDFSQTTVAISLGLGTTGLQTVNANLSLVLTSDMAIEMIVGSSGNDVLIGNALNNVLIGGAGSDVLIGQDGRDLLVGGTGADTLLGGNGDDILIGGTFSYFNEATKQLNRQAIDAIMAEWGYVYDAINPDLDYATRVGHLRTNSGGLNGSVLLDLANVPSETAIDSLFGDAGLDWFWKYAGDNTDKGSTETLN